MLKRKTRETFPKGFVGDIVGLEAMVELTINLTLELLKDAANV